MWRLHNRYSGSRAMTLVEVAITSGLVVVIGGVLLGLLIPMRTNCMSGQDRLAMLSQARLTADSVLSILEASVNPASLDGPAQGPALVFSEGKCSVFSTKKLEAGDPQLYTIQNVKVGDNNRQQVQLSAAPPASKPSVEQKPQIAGLEKDRFSTSVTFSYATQMDSVDLVQFQKDLPPGAYPRMIRVQVLVEDPDRKQPEVRLTASVPML